MAFESIAQKIIGIGAATTARRPTALDTIGPELVKGIKTDPILAQRAAEEATGEFSVDPGRLKLVDQLGESGVNFQKVAKGFISARNDLLSDPNNADKRKILRRERQRFNTLVPGKSELRNILATSLQQRQLDVRGKAATAAGLAKAKSDLQKRADKIRRENTDNILAVPTKAEKLLTEPLRAALNGFYVDVNNRFIDFVTANQRPIEGVRGFLGDQISALQKAPANKVVSSVSRLIENERKITNGLKIEGAKLMSSIRTLIKAAPLGREEETAEFAGQIISSTLLRNTFDSVGVNKLFFNNPATDKKRLNNKMATVIKTAINQKKGAVGDLVSAGKGIFNTLGNDINNTEAGKKLKIKPGFFGTKPKNILNEVNKLLTNTDIDRGLANFAPTILTFNPAIKEAEDHIFTGGKKTAQSAEAYWMLLFFDINGRLPARSELPGALKVPRRFEKRLKGKVGEKAKPFLFE